MTALSILHVSFEELCEFSSITETLMVELVEHGVVTPVAGAIPAEWQFSVAAVVVAKKASRIHHDLAMDWESIPLVLKLLEEIEILRAENSRLKQRLGRFMVDE